MACRTTENWLVPERAVAALPVAPAHAQAAPSHDAHKDWESLIFPASIAGVPLDLPAGAGVGQEAVGGVQAQLPFARGTRWAEAASRQLGWFHVTVLERQSEFTCNNRSLCSCWAPADAGGDSGVAAPPLLQHLSSLGSNIRWVNDWQTFFFQATGESGGLKRSDRMESDKLCGYIRLPCAFFLLIKIPNLDDPDWPKFLQIRP